MAKKTETIVTLTDDLDGSKAERTVSFAFEGQSYEIELSKKNAAAFEKALSSYIGAARRVRTAGGRARAAGGRSNRRNDLAAIREWAKQNGHEVSDRGRIAADIIDAYDSAH